MSPMTKLAALGRSNTVRPSLDPRPPTPQSSRTSNDRRHTTAPFRSLILKRRRGSLLSNAPSSSPSVAAPSPIEISDLAKSFVDALNKSKLSNFLMWFMYYDIVALPDSPDMWYSAISNLDMRGWTALGDYLSKTSQAMDTGTGFELVVLDSICDRLQIQRSTVHSMIIQFSDPRKMLYSQIATVVNSATKGALTKLQTFELVKAKLIEMQKLASRLVSAEGTLCADWQEVVVKHVTKLLDLVVEPRIANLRSGTPLVTAATADNLPKEVKDGIEMAWKFQALQPKRFVPLHRYGIFSSKTPPSQASGSVSSIGSVSILETPSKNGVKMSQEHAMQLMVDNRDLRTEVARMKDEKTKLEELNHVLSDTVAKLSRLRSNDPSRPEHPAATPPSSPPDALPQIAITPFHVHKHSASQKSIYETAAEFLQASPASPELPQFQSSTPLVELEDYSSSPQHILSPSVRPLTPMPPPVAGSRAYQFPPRLESLSQDTPSPLNRRSGMVFSEAQKDMLATMGETEIHKAGEGV